MENIMQQEKIAYLKRRFKVDKVTIKWQCHFEQIMNGDNVFAKEILPNLIFFTWMTVRQAMFPG